VLPEDRHLPEAERTFKHRLARTQIAIAPRHRVIEVDDAAHYAMVDRPDRLAEIIGELRGGV
jgi:hypothetical protein